MGHPVSCNKTGEGTEEGLSYGPHLFSMHCTALGRVALFECEFP